MLFPTHHLEYRCITRQKGNHSRCVLSSLWVAWITFSPTIQCPFKNSHRQSKTRNGCWNSPFLSKNPNSTNHLCLLMFWFYKFPPPKKRTNLTFSPKSEIFPIHGVFCSLSLSLNSWEYFWRGPVESTSVINVAGHGKNPDHQSLSKQIG